MKLANTTKVAATLVKPVNYASNCRCASLCQGGGVNCKGCKDQNATVQSVQAVYVRK